MELMLEQLEMQRELERYTQAQDTVQAESDTVDTWLDSVEHRGGQRGANARAGYHGHGRLCIATGRTATLQPVHCHWSRRWPYAHTAGILFVGTAGREIH
jgi:hypothetical protein